VPVVRCIPVWGDGDVHGAGVLVAGPAADAGAADDGGVVAEGFQRADLQAHAADFGMALFEPDVGVAHRLAVAGGVLFLPLPDELLGGGELPADLGQVAAVGREMVAAVTGVSLVAGPDRRQQAVPVRQDAVGAAVELDQVEHVAAVHAGLAAVPADLDHGEELALGGRWPGSRHTAWSFPVTDGRDNAGRRGSGRRR
jgi:hypothetical protein